MKKTFKDIDNIKEAYLVDTYNPKFTIVEVINPHIVNQETIAWNPVKKEPYETTGDFCVFDIKANGLTTDPHWEIEVEYIEDLSRDAGLFLNKAEALKVFRKAVKKRIEDAKGSIKRINNNIAKWEQMLLIK